MADPPCWLERGRVLHVRPDLTLEAFFRELNRRSVRYAVLRWFDSLPDPSPAQDIDLLVADEHLDRTRDLLTRWPVGWPCDLYSTTGLPGHAWHRPGAPPGTADMAVLPPHLAEEVLDTAVVHRRLVRIPDPLRHFLSLAYHAIYLKGPDSGIPSGLAPGIPGRPARHDYAATLRALAGRAGLHLPEPLTVEGLDQLLADQGWRAPDDVLVRVSGWNGGVRALLDQRPDPGPVLPGLTVFFLRRQAVEDGHHDLMLEEITSKGFDILHVDRLEGERARAMARELRGGNWGPGPWPASGGPPVLAVVAHDVLPRPRSSGIPAGPENQHTDTAKQEVRRRIAERTPPHRRYNSLHTTDTAREAWRWVYGWLPALAPVLRARVRALDAGFRTPVPVLEDRTAFGHRAKVEVVLREGRAAIRKTYRRSSQRHLRRELEFLERFGGTLRQVPPLLDAGSDYFVIPLYRRSPAGRLRRRMGLPVLMPLAAARDLAEFVGHVVAHGYDPIDLSPRNIILDPEHGLKVIDFEFVHRHARPGLTVEQAYCFRGIPADFAGDRPMGSYHDDPFRKEWYPVIGLSLPSLLNDPPWKQQLKRGLRYPLMLGRVLVRRAARATGLGRLIRAVRPSGRPALPPPVSAPLPAPPAAVAECRNPCTLAPPPEPPLAQGL